MTGKLVVLTTRDFIRSAEAANRKSRERRQWRRWHLHVRTQELVYRDQRGDRYAIDLERCATSAQVLDWLMQMRGKSWCSTTDIGYLADAFRDILDPQANLCSFGASKTLVVTTYLRERYGWGQGPC